ncbi:hypothetical protein [Scytonema sp. HK-05]|uniref:hypothetical protein n=1 Tax=Scytonema sp. HK-05 TaxID=1137095 RepID=UPI000937C7DA|nr:hypothetical protein [Scytonema sp. HK-05]OKH54453.1 hypothetical protein NIES2130_28320 [Scytonema sp. HK-05]
MPRSQPQAGNAYWEALPALRALLAASIAFPGETTLRVCLSFGTLRVGGACALRLRSPRLLGNPEVCPEPNQRQSPTAGNPPAWLALLLATSLRLLSLSYRARHFTRVLSKSAQIIITGL